MPDASGYKGVTEKYTPHRTVREIKGAKQPASTNYIDRIMLGTLDMKMQEGENAAQTYREWKMQEWKTGKPGKRTARASNSNTI